MDQPQERAEPGSQPAPPPPGPPYAAPSGPAYPAPSGPAYAPPPAAPYAPAPGPSYPPPAAPPPGPGGPAYGYPGSSGQITAPGAAVAPLNASAVVLLVISGLSVLATGVIGVPSAVLAGFALRANRTDPARSRRTTRLGWIVLAVNAVVGLGLIWALFWWLRAR